LHLHLLNILLSVLIQIDAAGALPGAEKCKKRIAKIAAAAPLLTLLSR